MKTEWKPNAKVIADSISPEGKRLTTLEVEMHRFVLAEFNTHRVFSRNSASSRAIPYQKMRAKALDSTAYPVVWPAEQKGMQGGAALVASSEAQCKRIWREALYEVVQQTDALFYYGLHKSLINRLLEPFIPHKAIVTATEWDGFFSQRLHSDAQPEIHNLAVEMKAVMDASTPKSISIGQWHTPYIDTQDVDNILDSDWTDYFDHPTDAILAVSSARCARVSYETHDGVRDVEKDYDLFFRLKDHVPAHASPFEHVARPVVPQASYHESNFKGWEQYRGILGLV